MPPARRRAEHRAGAVIALGAVLALLGASAAAGHDLRGSGGRPDPRGFLVSHPARRTVDLTLLAGLGSGNNGFNFDGYGRGELLVTVPLGWRVVVDCENRGGRRASCAVVRGPLSTEPAFPGAASPSPLVGLAPGAGAIFSFRATRTGSYRVASLVAGQEQARMWDVLDVARGVRPSISARPGP